jgi:hypothetical protein
VAHFAAKGALNWGKDEWGDTRGPSVRWRWTACGSAITSLCFRRNSGFIDVCSTSGEGNWSLRHPTGRVLLISEYTLGKEISQLKRLLAEKVQEVDFLKGALQRIEARRRSNEESGARASTTKSGK